MSMLMNDRFSNKINNSAVGMHNKSPKLIFKSRQNSTDHNLAFCMDVLRLKKKRTHFLHLKRKSYALSMHRNF